MIRPWKISEALIALGGAALLVLLGLIPVPTAFATILSEWNTLFFFLGMMSLSALAEYAGIFDWLAVQAARLSRNSVRRLFLNVFLLGCVISMVLSNDSTALILTPVVYALVTRLRLPVLPFLFACTFIADTASFLLPVSNPINIILLSRFPLDLFTFWRLLLPTSLVVIAVNIGIFFLLYRQSLRGQLDVKQLPDLNKSIRSRPYFRYSCCVLICVALAYMVASATRFPLSVVALGGAMLLLVGAFYWKQVTFPRLGKQISWPIFGFIIGMFIVVQALESTGLTGQLGILLLHLSGGTSLGAVLIGTAGAALGTNIINNVPMAVVLISSLQSIQHASPLVQQGFIVASIFGCDLGPNLTTVGSLATVMWLLILRQRNLDVSGLDYFKIGLIVTPLMLLLGALTIWIMLVI
jgi:arsenical pump membrane protein